MHATLLDIHEAALSVSSEARLTALEQAVVVLEDRRFFQHRGYDWRSIVRETLKAVTFRRHGGASTIDIQLFRTASNRYERTLRRKLREIIGAWALQRKCSKLQILRVYLDMAYFGTDLIGADEACQAMYGKSADDLNLDEASSIASMLVYPKPRVPTSNWRAKVGRRSKYGRLLLATTQQGFNQVEG